MRIILTGGTGFIGTPLRHELLAQGHRVILLTRDPARLSHKRSDDRLEVIPWDGMSLDPLAQRMTTVDAVINLAGEPIAAQRWSSAQKEKILQSRIQGTQALIQAMAQAKKRPAVLINASAVGFYGDVPEGDVLETRDQGSGFLADTCHRWEQEAHQAQALEVRVVCLRIGIVLGPEGGALGKMLLPFKMGVGGPLGSGKQWFPWIHREDVLGIILFALQQTGLSGAINVAAPDPVRMEEFCRVLGEVMHRPAWVTTPAWVLKPLLGEMSELVLAGQKAIPQKLIQAGYHFRYPQLMGALRDIVR